MIRIYVLSNPTNNEIFYVGATKLELNKRLQSHYMKVNEAERGDINWNNRLIYLKKMLPYKANITEIDRCNEEKSNELEQYYIKKYSENFNLTNQTIGGIGQSTYTMLSPEQKIITSKRISDGIIGPPKLGKLRKSKQEISDNKSGYKNPRAGVSKYFPIVLESVSNIVIFKNGIEANSYFSNKNAAGNLIKNSRHNKVNCNCRHYSKTYIANFKENCSTSIKDIVESLLEREGNCYVYDKHTKEVTIK
jgi:hypothetical protein